MTHGFTPGAPFGNTVVAVHLLSAVVIILSGSLQLIPLIRRRAPVFHRWNGRVYFVMAFTLSLAGLYMMWVRGSVGNLLGHIGNSLLAPLIIYFALMTLRHARARDFNTHRRWALRLYITVSASLFIRAAFTLSALISQGPFGFDTPSITGPYLTFIAYAQFLVPLGVLELYLRTQAKPGAARRIAMAAGLFVITLILGAGIASATAVIWAPGVKAALDNRRAIQPMLVEAMGAGGLDAAVKKYYELKASAPVTYNFDETELNKLGYDMIAARKYPEAIGIFKLNIEVYPQSSNAYDSLGEAYMDAGNKPLAIANYQRSLQLNPKNGNGVQMLRKLNAP